MDDVVARAAPAGTSAQNRRKHVEAAAAMVGALSLLAFSYGMMLPNSLSPQVALENDDRDPRAAAAAGAGGNRLAAGLHRQWYVGGYSGVSYTHPSTVSIKNGSATDMNVSGFDWIGRPFKSPIYYGLRGVTWSPSSRFGGMLDFTHAKAIATADDVATLTGTRNGRPVPPKAKISDTFRHLEFSHGHNMVTLNGLLSLSPSFARIRPYVGLGAGVALPHTEVGFRDEKARTYEYQFAGFVGQLLGGVEIPLGRVSVFFEYKFTYAPYEVPLSHEPYGWLLVTDLWRQLWAWWRNEAPPGGWLRTTLSTHHAVGGVLARVW